jgi:hypothetical protein
VNKYENEGKSNQVLTWCLSSIGWSDVDVAKFQVSHRHSVDQLEWKVILWTWWWYGSKSGRMSRHLSRHTLMKDQPMPKRKMDTSHVMPHGFGKFWALAPDHHGQGQVAPPKSPPLKGNNA